MEASRFDPRDALMSSGPITNRALELDPTRKRKELIKTIALVVIGSSTLATTAAIPALMPSVANSPWRLSVCLLFNGASTSTIFHPLVSPEFRRRFYKVFSVITYPVILFPATQAFLIFVPKVSKPIDVTGFVWFSGALTAKDTLQSLTYVVSGFTTPAKPPSEGEELPMLCGSPRNKTLMKLLLTTGAIMTTVSTVFYTLYLDDLKDNELQQKGILLDLITLCGGLTVGGVTASAVGNQKDEMETSFATKLLEGAPMRGELKAVRVVESMLMVFGPRLVSGLFASSFEANGVVGIIVKGLAGVIIANYIVSSRRVFTNLNSSVHSLKEPTQKREYLSCLCNKVTFIWEKLLKWTLLGALMAYMSWVAWDTGSYAVYGGVATMLASATFSTLLYTFIQNRFQPGKNNRFVNELAGGDYLLLYFFFYQYLTTKIDIYGNVLMQDSPWMYAAALFTWHTWGMGVGGIMGMIGQKRRIWPLLKEMTDPITQGELSKTLALVIAQGR